MKLLFLMWREWRLRPGRTVLTLFGMAAAVAVVFGSLASSSMVRRAYAAVSTALEGPPAVDIFAAKGGRFSCKSVPPLGKLDGVREAVPLLFQETTARASGKRWQTIMLGLGDRSTPAWNRLQLVSGRLPKAKNEVLLDAGVAAGLKLDSPLKVMSRRNITLVFTPLVVVGTVASQSLQEYGDGITLVASSADVQKIFNLRNQQTDRVKVFVAAGADREAVRQRLTKILPNTLVARVSVGRIRLADEMLRSTELALQFGSAMALAMAVFLVLNTLRMNFSERRWQFAVMRAIGATGVQVQRLILVEGLFFGVVGLILGVPGGLALAYLLSRAMQSLLDANLPPAMPGVEAVALSVVAGPLAAVAAAWFVARQSRSLSPLEGILGVEPSGFERFPRRALLLSAVCWIAAVVGLISVARGWIRMEWAIPAGLLMLVAFVSFIPVILRPAANAVAWLMRGRLATPGLLASRQAEQRATRMGLTVGVLVVAISNGLGLGHAVLDNVEDVRGWYRRSMAGDFLLQPAAAATLAKDTVALDQDAVAPDDDLVAQLQKTPGVSHVSAVRLRPARIADEPVQCVLCDFDRNASPTWPMSQAKMQRLCDAAARGQAVISSVLAKRLSLGPGDALQLEVQSRVYSVRVADAVNDYTWGGMVVFMDNAAAGRIFDTGPPSLYVITAASASTTLEASLRKFAGAHGCNLMSFVEARRQFDQLIDGVVSALFVLMGVGFVVGGLGVGNTLAMSVLEQTRELGLLRIVGMTRGQVRQLIFTEGFMIGTIGLVLGVFAGATTATIIHLCNWALLDRHVAFELHAGLLLANVAGCLIVTLLATWLPARRASRLNLLTAIAYE